MISLRERVRRMGARGVDPASTLRVRVGEWEEYQGLARFHYREKGPATCARVLVMERARGEVVAVLVVSRPTLDGAWRGVAWPGRGAGWRGRGGTARGTAAAMRGG